MKNLNTSVIYKEGSLVHGLKILERNISDNFENFGHGLEAYFSVPTAIYFLLIALCCFIFNTLLISVIVRKPSLQSVTNTLIINLAVGDMIIAIIVTMDAEFLLRGYYKHGVASCAVKESIFMFSLPSTVTNLLLLTFERFVGIAYPYKHSSIFTKKKIFVILLFTWTYTLLVALFPVLYFHKSPAEVVQGRCYTFIPQFYIPYQLFVHFVLPVIIIIVFNIALLIIASKHANKIRRQNSQLSSRQHSTTTYPKLLTYLQNVKAAKTIMLLVGVFLVCWLSFIILVSTNISCNVCHPRELTWTGSAVNYSSIAFNPLLYGMLNRPIRRELKRSYIWLKLFSKPRKQNPRDFSTEMMLL